MVIRFRWLVWGFIFGVFASGYFVHRVAIHAADRTTRNSAITLRLCPAI